MSEKSIRPFSINPDKDDRILVVRFRSKKTQNFRGEPLEPKPVLEEPAVASQVENDLPKGLQNEFEEKREDIANNGESQEAQQRNFDSKE